MLSQANDASEAGILVELPVAVFQEDSTTASESDYLLFYAQGPDRQYYDAEHQAYRIEKNLYDSANYCFIKRFDQPGKQIAQQPSIAYGASTLITEHQAVYHYEQEVTNLLGSGRRWLGESLDRENPSRSVRFPAQEVSAATIEVAVASRATSVSRFRVEIDDNLIDNVPIAAAQRSEYGYRAREGHAFLTTGPLPDNPTVTLHYESPTEQSGYVDFVTLNTREKLTYRDAPLPFSDPQAPLGILHHYQITGTHPTVSVWDVSDLEEVHQQAYQWQDSTLRFRTYADTLRRYVLFDPATLSAQPRYVGSVSPQEVAGLVNPTLLMVTSPALLAEAQRLAAFRRQHDQLTTEVVTLPQLYNAYASGRRDITAIRNYIRTLYQQDQSLRYVLLFGDASYDYGSDVLVPTYQSRQSFHSVHSYASDDYFGFLDSHEGEWPEQGNGLETHDLDVGIGRLPVRNPEEASIVVDKLIHYASASEALGQWRNEVVFVADDGDANKHQHQSDFLATYLEAQQPQFNAQRLFLDAFEQEEQPPGGDGGLVGELEDEPA